MFEQSAVAVMLLLTTVLWFNWKCFSANIWWSAPSEKLEMAAPCCGDLYQKHSFCLRIMWAGESAVET